MTQRAAEHALARSFDVNRVVTMFAVGWDMTTQVAGTSVEPLLFWRKDHTVAEAIDFARRTAVTLARLGSGSRVAHLGPRPAKRFELFERESCPFSRKVREALSILDLDAVIHPCPIGGERFRAKLEGLGQRFMIPVLVDPNVDRVISDSDEIVHHLFEHYGDGKVPLPLRAPSIANATSKLASAIRGDHGTHMEPSREVDSLLELYSYEASPHCRPVREKLTELQIPYLLHNVARGSSRRAAFVERSGKMQVPFIVDATKGVSMFESHAIVAWLDATYGRKPDEGGF